MLNALLVVVVVVFTSDARCNNNRSLEVTSVAVDSITLIAKSVLLRSMGTIEQRLGEFTSLD
jgi:hypothetical protein